MTFRFLRTVVSELPAPKDWIYHQRQEKSRHAKNSFVPTETVDKTGTIDMETPTLIVCHNSMWPTLDWWMLRLWFLLPICYQKTKKPRQYRGLINWSRWRESNPHGQLGRLMFYHWTTPANRWRTIRDSNSWSSPWQGDMLGRYTNGPYRREKIYHIPWR